MESRLSNVEASTSNSYSIESAGDRDYRSEESRFDEQVEGRLGEWIIGRPTAARYNDRATTAGSCRRGCRQPRHADLSTSRHVSRVFTRRRVVSRWLTVRRRCSVVIDRRDVTSGDDVTATDSESRSSPSCLDRAFVAANSRTDVNWQPDPSPIIVERKRRRAVRRTRVEDSDEHDDPAAHSGDSHSVVSPLTTPTTACDEVGCVVLL